MLSQDIRESSPIFNCWAGQITQNLQKTLSWSISTEFIRKHLRRSLSSKYMGNLVHFLAPSLKKKIISWCNFGVPGQKLFRIVFHKKYFFIFLEELSDSKPKTKEPALKKLYKEILFPKKRFLTFRMDADQSQNCLYHFYSGMDPGKA